MSLWRKLNTLFRATSQAPLEQMVDANNILIFEQEIRDAEQAVARSKRELACVMAEKNRLQRQNIALHDAIREKEAQVTSALDKDEEDLALEVADQIAADESILAEQQKQFAYLKKKETHLKKQLLEVVNTIKRYRSELRLAKANQSAENALKQLHGHSSGLKSHMADMSDSLDRIKDKQERYNDYDLAMQEIESDANGDQLQEKLKAAGIDNGEMDGHAVLERLRKKQAA